MQPNKKKIKVLKIKIPPRKTKPTKDLKRPRGGTGRGVAKLFLCPATVSGAGVLRCPNTLIMCLRVSDDIDAVIWVENA